jgi:hypothetical protein
MGSILPCCLPFGNAGGLQILRCQGFEVKYYVFTLDALTLKPSDVCNVGAYLAVLKKRVGKRIV